MAGAHGPQGCSAHRRLFPGAMGSIAKDPASPDGNGFAKAPGRTETSRSSLAHPFWSDVLCGKEHLRRLSSQIAALPPNPEPQQFCYRGCCYSQQRA